jgi:hypothetical protein
LIGRARSYLAKKEYSRAVDDANLALSTNPEMLEALYVRGRALLESTAGLRGREDLDKIIQFSQNPALVKLAQRALSASQ